jgi:multidrug/hemolysin transport system permease protein
MTGLGQLIRRNCKLFFKDKGMFFPSLITPIILLVLYVTFLGAVYRDSLISAIPQEFSIDSALIDATVAGQLVSSLLAVCCVTVAFCSNLLMVQDRVSGARRDLTVSPVGSATLAAAYFTASVLATLAVNFTALGACLVYLAAAGCWYLTAADVILLAADVLLLTLFGVAFSSCLHVFLTTGGQASAIGTLVSAGYGFICGAYMPISSYPEGLQKVLSLLPGTYATSLLRSHALAGAFDGMADAGLPDELITGIRKSIDCALSFFGHSVSVGAMYAVLAGSVLLFGGVYILINGLLRRKN